MNRELTCRVAASFNKALNSLPPVAGIRPCVAHPLAQRYVNIQVYKNGNI
jgi:hypothetical protein